jgi:nitrous-oxide reductase
MSKGTSRRAFFKKMATAMMGGAAGLSILKGLPGRVSEYAMGQERPKPKVKADLLPGELDDYYGFWSGGHSGEIRIVGVPSMNEIKRIPVFNMDCGSGWGYSNESKAMMKGPFVGDTHHVHMSYKEGVYDGKYLWVNDKANNRVARVRCDYMEVDKITFVPNVQGMHGIFPQRYPKTEWIVMNSEFQMPIPEMGSDLYDSKTYIGMHTIVDAETMEIIGQVAIDANLDLAATDYAGRYSFGNTYNAEGGATISEFLRDDRDFQVVFHWGRIKEVLKAGKYKEINGVKVIDARRGTEMNKYVTLWIPVPKNPHGVNVTPDGRYSVSSGKVSPTVTLVDIERVEDAFNGKIKPEDCIAGEPEVGLGPLHTAFDDKGNGYTSLFIDSQIVKWSVAKAIKGEPAVVDRLDIHYQVGHTFASMGETKEADGKYLVSANKISKDRFINAGPFKQENDQLIDISQDQMVLLKDHCVYIEPHDAIIVRRDILEPIVKHRYALEEHPQAVKESYIKKEKMENGRERVTVGMTANAPVYGFQEVTVNKGDEVTFIVTNNDEITDLSHGFTIENHGVNFVVPPYGTKSITFTADNPGMYWAYCTNFCHALHLEMRMRFIVKEV